MFHGKHTFFNNNNGIEVDANGIEAKPPTSELRYNRYRSTGPKFLPPLDPNDAVVEDGSSGFETWVLVPLPVPTDAASFHPSRFREPPRKPRPPRQPRTPRAPRVAREPRPSRQPRPSRRPRIPRPPRNPPASISPPAHPGIDDSPYGWENGSTAPARRSYSPSPSFVASETASESDLVPVDDDARGRRNEKAEYDAALRF